MLISALVLCIAALHFYFFLLEAYFWQKKLGFKTFKLTHQFAKESAMLAANQGLYNLFLCAGLIWAAMCTDIRFVWELRIFFLSCVSLAGIFGGITVNRKIFWVQGLPAIIILGLIFTHPI